ncbi:MAG TPA: methionyl-tRNA formyltransferase [Opitutaceae bacterium]|jgi:methionyl-tRNA formyltransferase
MGEPLRLVFMGSDPVALPLLDWLAGEGRAAANLAGIFTGPDRPSGRGQALRPNAVKAWSAGKPVEVFQPEKLGPAELEALKALKADAVLVVAYGHILRDEFISVPRLGTLNVHASLLPRLRGASPIQTAVASGEKETGVSLMRIVRELDAGPVAAVERVPIGPLDTAGDIERRIAAAAVPLVSGALGKLASGALSFREQDASQATFCRRLSKADGTLDFSAPAAPLAARVNGLFPWPSVTVPLNGESIRVGQADCAYSPGAGVPGTVVGADAHGLLIATGSGTLRLRRLQRPGGRMLEAREFLLGKSVGAGTLVASSPMASLVSPRPFPR